MNPVMLNANHGAIALNPQQLGLAGGQTAAPGVGGGYYYVSAADGTPMVMANPGMMGQGQPMLATQQLQGVNVNGMMAQQQIGMPGMVTLPPGGFPGMVAAPGGMMAMSPASNGHGNPSNASQQNGHNQFQRR